MGVVRLSHGRLRGLVWLGWLGAIAIACGPGQHAGDDETGSNASGSGSGGMAGEGDHRLLLAPPCAVHDGRLKCWGRNDRGQLGLGDTENRGDEPGEMGEALPFVDLGEGVRVASVEGSGYNTCALLTDGRVTCWGNNEYGQLGLGHTESRHEPGAPFAAIDLGTDAGVSDLAVGVGHVCALLSDGRVKCWGRNSRGQLGLGDTEPRGDEPGEMGTALPAVDLGTGLVVESLTAGISLSCALFTDGRVKCWGGNASGQLGLEDTEHRGDEPGEMGDALPFVDLGRAAQVVSLSGGSRHTCALLSGGRVKCWGYNSEGQLGLGHRTHRGDSAGHMGDSLPFVDLGSGAEVASLSVGGMNACVLLTTGAIKCWGSNQAGQLGTGGYGQHGAEPGSMGDNLPEVDLGADVAIVAVATARGHFACAHLSGDRVKCWGINRNGELGLGEVDERGRGHEPEHMGDDLPFVDLGFDTP